MDELEKKKKGNRVPVFDANDHPKYIIHRSAIEKYLVAQARKGKTPADPEKLTLKNLLDDDPDLKNLVETSFAAVKEDATLADAKDAMDNTPYCQDVFVTKSGTKNEPVLGWITNITIGKNAKV